MNTQLRKDLIRLAHTNPELRPHLMPLLKQATFMPSGIIKAFYGIFGGSRSLPKEATATEQVWLILERILQGGIDASNARQVIRLGNKMQEHTAHLRLLLDAINKHMTSLVEEARRQK